MNDVVREEKTVDEGFVNTLEDSTEEKGLDTKHIKWNKHLLINVWMLELLMFTIRK